MYIRLIIIIFKTESLSSVGGTIVGSDIYHITTTALKCT